MNTPAPTPADDAILMHSCCGPCSITPILRLRDMGFLPTLFFYNPNVHPLSEYLRRREGLLAVAAKLSVPVILADQPESFFGVGIGPQAAHPRPWLEAVADLGEHMDDMARRCPLCYDLRLSVAARTAKNLGFTRYTTSLLYSRYQIHQAILDSGARHAGPGLDFIGEDFRKGLLEGVRLSKQWGIYRQQYCGCMLSEHDRYRRLLPLESDAVQG